MLLPADVAPRRADTVEVVAAALVAHQGGAGHRASAADMQVPPDTVRSWLRRITARAQWLRQQATVWAFQRDPMLAPITRPGPCSVTPWKHWVSRSQRHRRRLGINASPWQILAMIAGGRLLAPLPPAPSG